MEVLYLVQIKSDAIAKENKSALIITMSMDKEEVKSNEEKDIHNAFIRDAIKLYPQYTDKEDHPIFSISRISKREYKKWKKTNILTQKSLARGVK